MKKLFNLAMFFMAVVTLLMPGVAKAQGENPMLAPLPVDTAVRMGKLPNGLTYYIRHNEYPKGQADFYIAQNVGSALEEDNQRGLAHFLEHMCFNGTTNFPGNQLRDWLASIGVRFGVNLNAYTGVDETVYNISNVPVARESVQDSCLLILHDWANDLTLDPKEIDKERGVIHEEWRRSNVGQMRVLERVLPDIYPTTKYGHRLPIGTMEVVDNFPHQALRDYYETWYRPEQQAVVVVGDIDVDRIENKIKEM
ncbi:MAG: insulinase family protein, partial [Duncaniella sp.]|nr:insulinase family protein [Duncaniella sp.]